MQQERSDMSRKEFGIWLGCVFVLAVLTSLSLARLSPTKTLNPASVDPEYDRVVKSNVLRCAYLVRPPNVIKDPNTGALSGIVVDFANLVGKRLGVRVDWIEEVSWGTMIEGLNTGRYDLIVGGIWANSTRGRAADFTIPMFYTGEAAFARAGDTRFREGVSALNAPAITLATMDGEMSSIIASSDFPDAQTESIPQFSDTSQLLLEVSSRKADATFVDTTIAARYSERNPGKIAQIGTTPVRIFPNCMLVHKGSSKLKSMLDVAMNELILEGSMRRLIRKYDNVAYAYYNVALPYDTPPEKSER